MRREKESKPIDSNGSSAPLVAGGETAVEVDGFAARSAPSILWLASGRAGVFRRVAGPTAPQAPAKHRSHLLTEPGATQHVVVLQRGAHLVQSLCRQLRTEQSAIRIAPRQVRMAEREVSAVRRHQGIRPPPGRVCDGGSTRDSPRSASPFPPTPFN